MAVLKNPKKALREERRKNEALEAQLAKEREITAFIGLLVADLDVNELYTEESSDNE